MKLDELREKIRVLHTMLEKPEPGLFTWQGAIRNKMSELCGEWQIDDTQLRLLMDEDVWGEYPQHPRDDWRYEVMNDDTNLGYWEWVANKKEMNSGA